MWPVENKQHLAIACCVRDSIANFNRQTALMNGHKSCCAAPICHGMKVDERGVALAGDRRTDWALSSRSKSAYHGYFAALCCRNCRIVASLRKASVPPRAVVERAPQRFP